MAVGLGLTLLLTLASGAALSFRYLPGDGSPSAWLSVVHRFAAWATTVVAFAWALVVARQRAPLATVAAVGLLVALVAAVVTGPALAWDQAALWSVTASFDSSGIWWVSDSDAIRFLLIDGMEVSVADYRRAVILHCGALTALAALLFLGSAVAASRRGRPSSDASGTTWHQAY